MTTNDIHAGTVRRTALGVFIGVLAAAAVLGGIYFANQKRVEWNATQQRIAEERAYAASFKVYRVEVRKPGTTIGYYIDLVANSPEAAKESALNLDDRLWFVSVTLAPEGAKQNLNFESTEHQVK